MKAFRIHVGSRWYEGPSEASPESLRGFSPTKERIRRHRARRATVSEGNVSKKARLSSRTVDRVLELSFIDS